jgi:hypothetical protein
MFKIRNGLEQLALYEVEQRMREKDVSAKTPRATIAMGNSKKRLMEDWTATESVSKKMRRKSSHHRNNKTSSNSMCSTEDFVAEAQPLGAERITEDEIVEALFRLGSQENCSQREQQQQQQHIDALPPERRQTPVTPPDINRTPPHQTAPPSLNETPKSDFSISEFLNISPSIPSNPHTPRIMPSSLSKPTLTVSPPH